VPAEISTAVGAKEAADAQKFSAAATKLDAAAAKKAAADQAAAERAAHPSLFARIMGAKPQPEVDATPVGAIPPSQRATPTEGAPAQTASLAATPIPRVKPDKLPDEAALRPTLTVAKKVPPKATAVSASVDSADPKSAAVKPMGDASGVPSTDAAPSGTAAPPVAGDASASSAATAGTIVKRKFDWPGDDDPAAPAPVGKAN
jgi:hypothetical protein